MERANHLGGFETLRRLFWHKVDYIILGASAFISIAAYLISFVVAHDTPRNLLIGVSSGLISSLFVIFGVDALRLKRAEVFKGEAKLAARKDLQKLANLSISYLLCPMRIVDLSQDPLGDALGDGWVAATNKRILGTALQADIVGSIAALTPDKFAYVRANFALMSSEFRDVLMLYSGLMPHQIQGKLLAMRQSFNHVSLLFSINESILFREELDRTLQRASIAKTIREYTLKIEEFTDSLASWD